MPFPYKRVLLIGATSGIGAAMADKLVQEGAKVIAVGRRQERLDAFVKKHGADRASAVRFDTTDRAGMDGFVSRILRDYPDLDCVFLNSGTQHPVRLFRPAEVDLSAFHREIDTNFSSIVDLCVKFLPHLLRQQQEKQTPTVLIITGTLIAIVPAVTMPAYSASKAALSAFVDCLRRQNSGAAGLKIVEIWPPAVQTELHDNMGEERGRALGMPVAQFTDEAYASLVAGSERIIVGTLGEVPPEEFQALVAQRQKYFDALANVLLSLDSQFSSPQ